MATEIESLFPFATEIIVTETGKEIEIETGREKGNGNEKENEKENEIGKGKEIKTQKSVERATALKSMTQSTSQIVHKRQVTAKAHPQRKKLIPRYAYQLELHHLV
jgi:hypothetical protein